VDSGVQAALGVCFLALGCLHLWLRNRDPQSRSRYFGAWRFAPMTRVAFAGFELLLGALLLLTV
jgi:hypothetical protein